MLWSCMCRTLRPCSPTSRAQVAATLAMAEFSRFLISSDSARPGPAPLLEARLTKLITEGIAKVLITVKDKSVVCLAVDDVGVVLGCVDVLQVWQFNLQCFHVHAQTSPQLDLGLGCSPTWMVGFWAFLSKIILIS